MTAAEALRPVRLDQPVSAAGLIRSGVLAADLDALVTARYALSDIATAFEHASNQPVFRVLVGNG